MYNECRREKKEEEEEVEEGKGMARDCEEEDINVGSNEPSVSGKTLLLLVPGLVL